MILGVLPLLGGGFTVYKAFSNAQQRIMNDEFVPEAWHNLPAAAFFPDHLGEFEGGYAWARQGIDETSSCADPGLERPFAEAVAQHGCQAVLRATYVDATATWVTTIAVVVMASPEAASAVYAQFDPGAEHTGPLVQAYPVPGTPAADWTDEHRGGVALDTMFLNEDDQPYLAAVAVGYVDGRPVEVLPEPWELTAGTANERMLDTPAFAIEGAFTQRLHATIAEPSQ